MVIQFVRKFKRDTEGGILVFAGLSLAILLGMVAMVFDMGRMATTHTQLQAFADTVALAAAGELDGEEDSVLHANNAAARAAGTQTFGEGANVLGGEADYTLRYAETLPDNDNAPITFLTNPLDPDNQKRAAYVEVTVTPRDVDLPFARAFAALSGTDAINNTVSAVSVAGFVSYACDITPLMFCVPDGWKSEDNVGQSVFLRSGGNGAQWGPGAFGFLDVTEADVDPSGPCAGLNGSTLTACMIAAVNNINACFSQRGVNIEPGQKVGIENSVFNTRFDMFNTIMSKYKDNPQYAPGPHVTKGFVASNGNGQCVGQSTVVADTMAFPKDTAYPFGNNRFGNSSWEVATYLETNHGAITSVDSAGETVIDTPASYMYDDLTNEDGSPNEALLDRNGDKKISRHEVYLTEIALSNTATPDGGAQAPIYAYRDPTTMELVPSRSESGVAQCSPIENTIPMEPGLSAITKDRRLFTAAAVDCGANAINGAKENVPVAEFVKIFLTKPVGESNTNPPNFEFYVEVVGSAGTLGEANIQNGLFNDVVQLYR